MADVFTIVTNRIISEMEKGIIPWHRPWSSIRSGAFSRVTKRPYSLLNQMLLKFSGEYATYSQWTKLGGKIRQGEKPEIVVFWKWPENDDKEAPGAEEKNEKKRYQSPVLRYYRVYHVSQIDGVEPLSIAENLFETEPIEAAENLFRGYTTREHIRVATGPSNKAFYSPSQDLISVPDIRQFVFPEEFYSTALHEAIHSTGHANRLNRIGIQKVAFGSETYSREELVAEIGAAALLNDLGIESETSIKNSTAYIQNWLSVLRDDKRMIVMAASQAEKAVNFIMQRH